MPLFLTILEGATPDEARPILAIRDAQILATVRAMIHARLREASPTRPHVHTVLQRVPQEVPRDDE
jgi:hypothetical protein